MLQKICFEDWPQNQEQVKPARPSTQTYITADVFVRPPVDIAQKDVLQVFLAQQMEPKSLHGQSGSSVTAKSTPDHS